MHAFRAAACQGTRYLLQSTIMETLKQHNIILASKSPRRRELLAQAGLSFTVMPSDFDEAAVVIKEPAGYAMHLAENKARDIAVKYHQSVVIGADTIVIINNAVLNKPKDTAHAREMLLKLAGNTHQVVTAFCIICEAQKSCYTAFCQTDVTFKALSAAELEWYIHTDEPYDKAGGYAIQGLGSFLVEKVDGSYTNVVGLPVCEVLDYLYKAGFIIPKNLALGACWQTVTEVNNG